MSTPHAFRPDRVYVIAEAGSNWRMGTAARDERMGFALIDAAAEAGADAVKFQTYRPETVYVPNAGQSEYLAAGGILEDIREIFADLAMPYPLIPKLAEHATRRGLDFMSTAFSLPDFEAVDPHVSVHKIASYEISHVRLIERAARSGKPTIMSTGAATLDDVAWAVAHFQAHGGGPLCLLQCTAKYPAPPEAMNLRAIETLRARFSLPVGLSDHSLHPTHAPIAAAALGACVVEKHFTLDRRLPGPDHAFAVTPDELADMVRGLRAVEQLRGTGEKVVLEAERELAAYARRGVQVTRPVAVGEMLVEGENLEILRPGNQPLGVHPRRLAEIEGRRATRALRIGEGLRDGDWS
jgi:N-acetylneuraminate synthase